ncbi:hypothetical protein [Arthrobacter sp. StoSoilA2]|uniref:hypothetical protein n=1 Tax=Arthrobacter sp. StoSoilA2 TaxID=2830990 RepID=UPI001CC4A2ED|nr:hypothetical protein [Arthrobacter sp. StoSoilA2]
MKDFVPPSLEASICRMYSRFSAEQHPASMVHWAGIRPRVSAVRSVFGTSCCASTAMLFSAGGDDDLVVGVDHGLGVVAVVVGPVGGLHDPGVRVGEVSLGSGIGFSFGRGFVAFGHSSPVAIAAIPGFLLRLCVLWLLRLRAVAGRSHLYQP